MTVYEFMSNHSHLCKLADQPISIAASVQIALALCSYSQIATTLTRKQAALYDKYGEVVDGRRMIKPENVKKFDAEFRELQATSIEVPKLNLSMDQISTCTAGELPPAAIRAMMVFSGVVQC